MINLLISFLIRAGLWYLLFGIFIAVRTFIKETISSEAGDDIFSFKEVLCNFVLIIFWWYPLFMSEDTY